MTPSVDIVADDDIIGAVLALAKHEGAASIKDLPGCWEVQIDEQWFLAVNGHKVETPIVAEVAREDARSALRGTPVPAFAVFVAFNGWPAAAFRLADDHILFAAGEAANAKTFVAAIRRRISSRVVYQPSEADEWRVPEVFTRPNDCVDPPGASSTIWARGTWLSVQAADDDETMHRLVHAARLSRIACVSCGAPLEAYVRDPDDPGPEGGWRCIDCGGRVAKARKENSS
jgi:hypothetical protein